MKLVATAAAIFCAAALAPNTFAQALRPLVLTGRVVADDAGHPIPNVRVSAGGLVVLTDGDGRFTIATRSPIDRIKVSKPGYGPRTLLPADWHQSSDIRLTRGAAISGRVVDEFGDPLPVTRVVAESAADGSLVAATQTDDRGDYRIGSLPAGTFTVATVRVTAASMNLPIRSPAKSYYPGTTSAQQAESVRLAPGDDRPRLDFVLSADPLALPPTAIVVGASRAPDVQDRNAGGTAIVRGRVTATDGRSVPQAQVRLLSQPYLWQSKVTRADGEGRFEFRDVPAGKFQLVASKPGYSAPPAEPISMVELRDGQVREHVELRLAPWGTVTGRVLDEFGDPMQDATVQALQIRNQAGRRRLVPAGGFARATDDLGRYRLFGLPPGQYIISASVGAAFSAGGVSSADVPGYGRSYFPAATDAVNAQFVSVAVGPELSGIDIALSRVRTARVSGTLLNAAGEATMGGSLTLTPNIRSGAVTDVSVGARISANGSFEFPNVPPGQYVVRADRGRERSRGSKASSVRFP